MKTKEVEPGGKEEEGLVQTLETSDKSKRGQCLS